MTRILCDWITGGVCDESAVVRYRGDESYADGHRCAEHAKRLDRSVVTTWPILPVAVSAADIEQLVADAENKLDDGGSEDVAYDLIQRLRILAGLDVSGYPAPPMMDMTIGRRDECLISVPHSHEFCGKPEAHRD